jgi:hypothetical protein
MRRSLHAGVFLLVAAGAWPTGAGAQAPDLETSDPDFARGHAAGVEAAHSAKTLGWAARGFAGGVLLGPVGTVAVTRRATRAPFDLRADDLPVPQVPADDPRYRAGFDEAYRQILLERRKEAALVGGMVGTTVFTFAVIRLVRLRSEQSQRGGLEDEAPTLIRIPVPAPGLP